MFSPMTEQISLSSHWTNEETLTSVADRPGKAWVICIDFHSSEKMLF